jgi:hypothetical protein
LNCSLILVIFLWTIFSLWTVPSYWWFFFELFSLFELFPHIGDFSLNCFLSLNCSLILVIFLWTVFSLWTVPSYWWFIFVLFSYFLVFCLFFILCHHIVFMPPRRRVGGILIYPCPSVRPFVRPDIDTWFVRLQFWSYSFNIL